MLVERVVGGAIAALFTLLLVAALREGGFRGPGGPLYASRRRSPAAFWSMLTLYGAVIGIGAFLAVMPLGGS